MAQSNDAQREQFMMQACFKSLTRRTTHTDIGLKRPRSWDKWSVALLIALSTTLFASASFAQFSSQNPNAVNNATNASGMSGSNPQATGTASPVPNMNFRPPPTPQGVVISNQPTMQLPGQDPRYQQTSPMALEPEPPTEFQTLTETTTGKLLPLFGRDLFSRLPSSFAPIDGVPVTSDYVLGPGDEVVIRAWGQIDVDYRVEIDRNGEIYVPKVGNINLAGLPFSKLNDHLKTSVGRVFQNFQITSSLGKLRSITVYVVGQARRPGSYTLNSMSTLVNALFAAGGPSASGSMRSIQLKRNGKVVTDIDLYNLLTRGDMTGDARLLPGDVIYIPPVGPQVALSGSVISAAIYELKGSTSLAKLMELSGGINPVANGDRVTVERIIERRRRTVEEFTLNDAGLSMPLTNGDIITVWPISPRFESTVTLRGNVKQTARRPWRQGMKLSDLIPNKDVLISPDYWEKVNALTIKQKVERDEMSKAMPGMRNDPLARATKEQGENLLLQSDLASSGKLLSNQQQMPQSQSNQSVQQPGKLAQSPDRQKQDGEPSPIAKNEVNRMLEEINWDYAVIERLEADTLSPKLIPFNLGKLVLELDPASDVPLEPGDSVVIFNKLDVTVPISRQTRYVVLAGEFKQAGVHQAKAGETLRQLVKRIGGLTTEAYPYGAEFTRKSARVDQQRKLDAMLDQMERDLERSASTRLQSAADSNAVVAQEADIRAARARIEKLRQLKASGRIPLELRPDTTSDQLPDLLLEDGDKLIIPSKPTVLSVFGSVYNENSFLYKPNKSLADYLAQAGGSTRDADEGRTYVLRADGTIAINTTSWFGLGSSYKLLPGDSIVVPERLNKTTWVKDLRDWTQIMYQFGIGVAALRTLRN
ncbi:MAG: hypothetical protein FJY60_04875, partial [Betaproteobacteria bacterium]|nr:hypothetical protein [Betaproteobacteria bacterium]